MSKPEDALANQLTFAGIGDWEREFRFAPPRHFKADFAFPAARLLVEIEGGQWVEGRHNRPQGYANDCRKYNLAVLMGYRTLRFVPAQVDSGEALETLGRALGRVVGQTRPAGKETARLTNGAGKRQNARKRPCTPQPGPAASSGGSRAGREQPRVGYKEARELLKREAR
jgi:hypothetical protein